MKWEIIKLVFNDYDEAVEYLMDEDKLFPTILDGFRFLSKNELSTLEIIELNWGTHLMSVSISRKESDETLSKLMEWLEKNERYEECSEVLSLKERM